MNSKRKLFFILVFIMLPNLGWGKCFSDKIMELANSDKPHKARVIANNRLNPNSCKLTLVISSINITGEAKNGLCRATKNSIIDVNVHTFCCDTPPCDKTKKNKIWFTQPTYALKTAKPAMAQALNSAPKQQRRPASVPSETTISKNPQLKPKIQPINNETRVTSSANVAIGKGSTAKLDSINLPKSNGKTSSPSLALISPNTESSKASHAGGLEQYKVKLGVDGKIQKPGPPGELKVWIGDPKVSANFSEDMATTETTVPAIGQSAKVTPYAPDFDVTPKESICMKIHPSGSEAHFAITPKSTGRFKVGADVYLFESEECSGTPVPKSATTLTVEVMVNEEGIAKNLLLELWEVLWQGVLDFWKWLVATIFGLFIFLIRKRLKKWFAFDA